MQLTELQERCLRAIVDRVEKYGFALSESLREELKVTEERLESTLKELVALRVIEQPDFSRGGYEVKTRGEATLYLNGQLDLVPPGYVKAQVTVDRETVAQLVEAIAALNAGNQELVSACSELAAAIRTPRGSNRLELVQTAMTAIQLTAEHGPKLVQLLAGLLSALP